MRKAGFFIPSTLLFAAVATAQEPAALAPAAAPVAPAAAQPTLPDSVEIFNRIIAKYKPMYDKYSGIEFKAESTTWMYDTDTNELKETSELISVAVQPFYGDPEKPTILKYVKDGEELSPDDYPNRGGGEPMYPIFDAKGPERYTVKVVDKTAMSRQQCFVLEVTGKDKTARHFEGSVYVNAETLALVYMDGGMADTPFGVDSMRFQTYLRQEGELSLWDKSTFTAVVDIPIIFPDTMMVSRSKVLEAKGVPK